MKERSSAGIHSYPKDALSDLLGSHTSVLLHHSIEDSEAQGQAEWVRLTPFLPLMSSIPSCFLGPPIHMAVSSSNVSCPIWNPFFFLLPFTSPLQTAFHLGSPLLLVVFRPPDHPDRTPGEPLDVRSPLPPVPESITKLHPIYLLSTL